MANILEMFMVELRPGVKGADFEKFFQERHVPSLQASLPFPGWYVALTKGERGEREGKYLVCFETENTEVRNRVWPTHTQLAPADSEAMQAVLKEWEAYAAWSYVGTSYELVSGTKSAVPRGAETSAEANKATEG